MRLALVILALLSFGAQAAVPTTCRGTSEYERALCSYQKRQFAEAEAGFRAIASRTEQTPETIRSIYFLGRTLMKTGRYDEASSNFMRIYSMDRAFYDTWNCDYLLGECRKALGK